jgi:hypothetical protein
MLRVGSTRLTKSWLPLAPATKNKDSIGESLSVTWLEQESVELAGQNLRYASAARSDYRYATRHRLQYYLCKCLIAYARHDDDVRGAVERRHVGQ